MDPRDGKQLGAPCTPGALLPRCLLSRPECPLPCLFCRHHRTSPWAKHLPPQRAHGSTAQTCATKPPNGCVGWERGTDRRIVRVQVIYHQRSEGAVYEEVHVVPIAQQRTRVMLRCAPKRLCTSCATDGADRSPPLAMLCARRQQFRTDGALSMALQASNRQLPAHHPWPRLASFAWLGCGAVAWLAAVVHLVGAQLELSGR